jgi:hypothetical protein
MDKAILTYDEKKAAEAAFQGRPFNPTWSASARGVFDGIVNVLVAKTPLARMVSIAPSEEFQEGLPIAGVISMQR